MILNPFKHLFETKTYPHAQVFRTSFLEKMKNTFIVFSGALFLKTDENEKQAGLFDFLWFPLLLAEYFFGEKMLVKALQVLLFIPRIIISIIGTVISSPFIFITHLISGVIAEKERMEILNTKVTVSLRGCAAGIGEDYMPHLDSLGNFLKEKGLSLDNLSEDYGSLRAPGPDSSFLGVGKTHYTLRPASTSFSTAFFKLNVARLQTKQENSQSLNFPG